MKIKNISFITPLIDRKKYTLDEEYSKKITLKDGSTISLASNIGPREEQEDSLAITCRDEYILLLVADGVGGEEKGNEASYIVAKKIQQWFTKMSKRALSKLDSYTLRLHITGIINEIKENDLTNDSGTTLNMSLVCPDKTFIVNIGDSRTYSMKDNEIDLMTKDDSLAFKNFNPQTARERDILRFYESNNYITRSISKSALSLIKVTAIENEDYDILCHVTDGVSDILSENKIKENCLKENAAQLLVDSSVNSGPIYSTYRAEEFTNIVYPHDNATAIVYTKKKTKNN